jgi:hypothetical protein
MRQAWYFAANAPLLDPLLARSWTSLPTCRTAPQAPSVLLHLGQGRSQGTVTAWADQLDDRHILGAVVVSVIDLLRGGHRLTTSDPLHRQKCGFRVRDGHCVRVHVALREMTDPCLAILRKT